MVSLYLFQALAACMLLVVARWVYRLTLHPLAKVPGPKLAAMTSAYAMSYDLNKSSSYIKKFPEWHAQYGPIIRIEPNHVHILDIDSYNKVFKIGTKFYRDPAIYSFPFTKGGFFNKLHVKDAKPHRDLYMGYFSRNAVQILEPVIRQHLVQFFTQLEEAVNANKKVDLTRAFRCLTADTLMRYSYDKPFGATTSPDFIFPMLEAISNFFDNSALGWYLPNLMGRIAAAAKAVPRSWTSVDAGISASLQILDGCLARIVELRGDPTKKNVPSVFKTAFAPNADKGHPILTNNDIASDGLTIFVAGTDTTAHTLTNGTYHLLRNPSILAKLQAELHEAIPSSKTLADMPLDWTALEALPYLRAVIKECLRISSPVPGKLPRMVPDGGAELVGTYLPPGTAVSMAMHVYHSHPGYFPQPEKFIPERWLDNGAGAKEINEALDPEKAFMPFSRGSRNCIGQNLAWAELFYCFGYLLRRFELEGVVKDQRGLGMKEAMEWKDSFVVVTKGHLEVKVRRAAE